MKLQDLLVKNGSSIFASLLNEPNYKNISNKIFVPDDKTLKESLDYLGLNADLFAFSPYYNEIINQHILNTDRTFKFNERTSTIDNIPVKFIGEALGGSKNQQRTSVYLIDGMLLTAEQFDDLERLGGMLKFCPKTGDSEQNVTCENSNDAYGYGIFSVFDRKYRADKIFERAANKILDLYRQKNLTQKGLAALTNVVELYSEAYDKFVAMVKNQRMFFEKASSGKPPIKLVTAENWGEAIIELVDLVNKFNATLEDQIKFNTSSANIQKECSATKIDQCGYPCNIKSNLLGRKSCEYKRK